MANRFSWRKKRIYDTIVGKMDFIWKRIRPLGEGSFYGVFGELEVETAGWQEGISQGQRQNKVYPDATDCNSQKSADDHPSKEECAQGGKIEIQED